MSSTGKAEPAVLSAKGVHKIYRARRGFSGKRVDVAALSGVDLDVFPRETVGVVGETGSGKSTLGRLLLGLDQPTRGEIRLDGHVLRDLSRAELKVMRRRVQVVFQDPYESLNPFMTVEEILQEPFRIHEQYDSVGTPARIRELLGLVGLPDNARVRTPSAFSGGQQQRIAIARALALGPEVLIADEPTAALDVSIQAQILNLLLELQHETHMAILLISHNLLVVRHMSRRLAVMYGGRVVESGSAEALYQEPKHPYTTALLSAIPVANPKRERVRKRIAVEGEAPDPAKLPSGCVFHPRCWMAVERCRVEPPELRPVGRIGQSAACHLAS